MNLEDMNLEIMNLELENEMSRFFEFLLLH